MPSLDLTLPCPEHTLAGSSPAVSLVAMSADPHSSPPGQQGPGHGNQPSEEILAVESRNLLALAAHYISLRLGWIFKTETVIMPAVMDAISGAGWLRGCLPVVNRVCSSLPPLFYAPQLKAARRKRTMLTLATLTMAVPFLILAGALDARNVLLGLG